MPSGETRNKLASIINKLSDRYETPRFVPHVTLLGGITENEGVILSKMSYLAGFLKPFQIQLAEVKYLDEYFRALFILAEKTKELLGAYGKARNIFDVKESSSYMPHLSLMYGNLAVKTKEEILAKIGREFRLNFWIDTIYLFSTTGEASQWYKVQEFPLRNQE